MGNSICFNAVSHLLVDWVGLTWIFSVPESAWVKGIWRKRLGSSARWLNTQIKVNPTIIFGHLFIAKTCLCLQINAFHRSEIPPAATIETNTKSCFPLTIEDPAQGCVKADEKSFVPSTCYNS